MCLNKRTANDHSIALIARPAHWAVVVKKENKEKKFHFYQDLMLRFIPATSNSKNPETLSSPIVVLQASLFLC